MGFRNLCHEEGLYVRREGGGVVGQFGTNPERLRMILGCRMSRPRRLPVNKGFRSVRITASEE